MNFCKCCYVYPFFNKGDTVFETAGFMSCVWCFQLEVSLERATPGSRFNVTLLDLHSFSRAVSKETLETRPRCVPPPHLPRSSAPWEDLEHTCLALYWEEENSKDAPPGPCVSVRAGPPARGLAEGHAGPGGHCPLEGLMAFCWMFSKWWPCRVLFPFLTMF